MAYEFALCGRIGQIPFAREQLLHKGAFLGFELFQLTSPQNEFRVHVTQDFRYSPLLVDVR